MPTFILNGLPLGYGPFVTGEGDEAVQHSAAVLDVWSDADLSAIGVVRIPDPEPPPPGPAPVLPAWKVRYILAGEASASGTGTKLDDATNAVASLNDVQAMIRFENEPNWAYDYPLLRQIAAAIGITNGAPFDALWAQAEAVE